MPISHLQPSVHKTDCNDDGDDDDIYWLHLDFQPEAVVGSLVQKWDRDSTKGKTKNKNSTKTQDTQNRIQKYNTRNQTYKEY